MWKQNKIIFHLKYVFRNLLVSRTFQLVNKCTYRLAYFRRWNQKSQLTFTREALIEIILNEFFNSIALIPLRCSLNSLRWNTTCISRCHKWEEVSIWKHFQRNLVHSYSYVINMQNIYIQYTKYIQYVVLFETVVLRRCNDRFSDLL